MGITMNDYREAGVHTASETQNRSQSASAGSSVRASGESPSTASTSSAPAPTPVPAPVITQALSGAGLPDNARNRQIVSSLIAQEQPIDAETLKSVARTLSSYPSESPDAVILLRSAGIEITPASLEDANAFLAARDMLLTSLGEIDSYMISSGVLSDSDAYTTPSDPTASTPLSPQDGRVGLSSEAPGQNATDIFLQGSGSASPLAAGADEPISDNTLFQNTPGVTQSSPDVAFENSGSSDATLNSTGTAQSSPGADGQGSAIGDALNASVANSRSPVSDTTQSSPGVAVENSGSSNAARGTTGATQGSPGAAFESSGSSNAARGTTDAAQSSPGVAFESSGSSNAARGTTGATQSSPGVAFESSGSSDAARGTTGTAQSSPGAAHQNSGSSDAALNTADATQNTTVAYDHNSSSGVTQNAASTGNQGSPSSVAQNSAIADDQSSVRPLSQLSFKELVSALSEKPGLEASDISSEGIKRFIESAVTYLENAREVSHRRGDEAMAAKVDKAMNSMRTMLKLNDMYAYAEVPIKNEDEEIKTHLRFFANKKTRIRKDEGSSAVLHLNMPSLKELDIRMVLKGNSLRVDFFSSKDASKLLESESGTLSERLSAIGVDPTMDFHERVKEPTPGGSILQSKTQDPTVPAQGIRGFDTRA